MEISKTEFLIYEPGFNIENGEVFDRIGGNINIDIRPGRNGTRIPEHEPLFVPQKKNQQKYICMCDSVKGGTELTCYSGFLAHCKKRTHNTWLQQQEDRHKISYNLVKDHYNKSIEKEKNDAHRILIEQKKDLDELVEYTKQLEISLNNVSSEMINKDNKINELTKEKYSLEDKNIELQKNVNNSNILCDKYKKLFKKERKKFNNLLLRMELEEVNISDTEIEINFDLD